MFISSFINCYLILQVFLGYLNGVVLDSISVPLVGDLLSHQLLKDEEQQLVIVPAEGQVAGKCLDRNTDNTDVINIKSGSIRDS